MKKILLFLLFFVIFLPTAYAEEKTVVINEIMWMGSEKSIADEWIELRNLTSTDIDISGWEIKGAASGGGDLIIPAESIILANEYFLIANYSAVSEKSILSIEPDFVTTSVSLSNGGAEYKLFDSAGYLIDEVGSGPGYPLSGDKISKRSQERILSPTDGVRSNNWYTSTGFLNIDDGSIACATPGGENSKEPEDISIIDAKLAEREIIVRGIVTVSPDLLFENRFYIQDDTAGIRIFLEKSSWPELKIGDYIRLRGRIGTYHSEKEIVVIDDSDLEILEEHSLNSFSIKTAEAEFWEGAFVKIYGKIVETSGNTFYVDDGSGRVKIYVKDELNIDLPAKRMGDKAEIKGVINNWDGSFRILPITKDGIKIISQKKIKQIYDLPIAQIKKLSNGTLVITRGVVTVPGKVLANTYFYIQDKSSGIQIYCWYKDFPDLNLGDYIKVYGEISETYGEKRIKIKSARDIIVLRGEEMNSPKRLKIININQYQGMLVLVRGRITKSSGKTFYISDGTGKVKIYITGLANIKKPRTYKNDLVEIIGIVSMSKSGFRILPRYQNDFKLLWTKPKKEKVVRKSTFKKINFGEPRIMISAERVVGNGVIKEIGYLLLFLSSSSLILLGGLKYKKIL